MAANGEDDASGRTRRLPADELDGLVDDFVVQAEQRTYEVSDHTRWPKVDRAQLPEDHASIVRFITFIEDHIPGYHQGYLDRFPLDEDVPLEEFMHNRELYRFTIRWAVEEERHARLLFKYQTHAGIAERESLRVELAREGRKPFDFDARETAAVVAYTVIQEKATQVFYRQFAKVVQEPLLKQLLGEMMKDEARHFAFFASVLQAHVKRFGPEIIDPIKDVLQNFKMPLALTLRGYWRWVQQILSTVEYDHFDAYDHLTRTLHKAADARTRSKVTDLETFIQSVRGVQ